MNKKSLSILSFGLFLGLFSHAQAKEVFLECKVTKQSQYFDGQRFRDERETISVSFDEQKGSLGHDTTIGKGCKSDELTENTKCDCHIAEKTLGCDTEGKEKYAPITIKMWFTVHRFTGRFTGVRIVTNHEKNTGSMEEYDGSCEKFISKKF